MNLIEIVEKYQSGGIYKSEYIRKMHDIHRMLFEYADYIRDTDIHSINIGNGEIVMTTKNHGIKMLVDMEDMRIAPIEILNFGSYEKEELDMIDRLLTDNANILDIGANIGWYTINLAKMKRNASIHAFEPLPRTFDYLKKNVDFNSVDNATLYNVGLSDKNGTFAFYYYPEISGNASLANLSEREDVEEIECKVLRLDDFMREHNFAVDFIKCDVEGAELLVFQGGVNTIAEHKPIVFTEMLRKWSSKYGYHPNDILSLFTDMDFCCFTVKGGKISEFVAMDENTIETNFIFLHQEKHKKQIELLCSS